MKHSNHRRSGQSGMTLLEILVAVAILAVAMIVVLTIYDLSRKSFKKGENVTEQQQSVRIAFDQMIADLRMTGFNYNPDGSKARPDEQFEAAYDTAIVVRGDYDAEDATESLTPESTLGGTMFLAVSTGNDEIYTYVLAKPDGSSTGSMTFQADVQNATRDGVVETVTIPNVAMVHNDPPYTLYRITLNNDTTTWGTAAFLTRTPLIDNVYSMNFRYYNQTGLQSNSSFDLTTTTDDIGGVDGGTAETTRTGIRRVGIELTGLTPEPDMNWEVSTDPYAATAKHRKFSLAGDITPRNIGMVGIQDLSSDVTPPGKPATPSLVVGHCGGIWLTWAANPTGDQVAYYRVNLGTGSGAYSESRTTSGTSMYVGALSDATGYYVALQAVDASGNQSIMSDEASATTSNVNTPNGPLNLTATTGLNGAVDLSWDAVTTNTAGQPAGDPTAPQVRDMLGYRVHRGPTNGFNNPGTVMIADESIVQNRTNPGFTDTSVVNCRSYHYWVQAVDACGVTSSESASASGNSTTTTLPRAPEGLQVFYARLGIRLTWEPVTKDVSDADITIDSYNVYRSPLVPDNVALPGDRLAPDAGTFTYIGTAVGANAYIDTFTVPTGYTVYYTVAALDDCGNLSAQAEPANPECAFVGDVYFESPAHNTPVVGVVPIVIRAGASAVVYRGLTLEFIHELTGATRQVEILTPGPIWRYEWLADPPGPYTIIATVTNDQDCSKSSSIHVAAGTDVGCCLSQANPDMNPIELTCTGGGNAKCATVSYEIINNNCLTAVAVESMSVDWQDVTTLSPYLTGVFFDGSPIWSVTPASAQPAATMFSDPKPSIDVSRNSTFPVQVTYTYTQNMSNKIGQTWFQNTLTTSYRYRLLDETGAETSITGTCGPSTGMFGSMIVGR